MHHSVIQGCFVGAQASVIPRPAQGVPFSAALGGGQPLSVAPAGIACVAQARLAAIPVAPAQRTLPRAAIRGDGNSFRVNPVQIGIASGGGSRLPSVLLAKMEAAFGADFSSVRVHIGPQAARIGAVAFTMGNQLYFSPGMYQPNSVRGQALIGHELAHVIQQRQGRVRAPAPGMSVVRDKFLEAEADRLGMQAASHTMQRRSTGPVNGSQSSPLFAQGVVQRSRAQDDPDGDDLDDDDDDEGDDDMDGDYKPRQSRPAFSAGKAEAVIRRTAHQKKVKNIDTTRYKNVWTCPVCARPLAYETVAGTFMLTQYAYQSKKNNNKEQRALEIDHHPTPWASVLKKLRGNESNAQLKALYNNQENLRALCRSCNGSHRYEGMDVPGYDSDDSNGPGAPSTPTNEPKNQGQFSFFKRAAGSVSK